MLTATDDHAWASRLADSLNVRCEDDERARARPGGQYERTRGGIDHVVMPAWAMVDRIFSAPGRSSLQGEQLRGKTPVVEQLDGVRVQHRQEGPVDVALGLLARLDRDAAFFK